ncbi:MAG: DUF1015 domain-containing protein [Clostridiales bacterium]|nr:DUF1015 domain-containing protein [Clostridiales bacterium]
MSVIRPFKAIRPAANLASKVAALPYDVMSSDEAREMVIGNPYSFLHIDKAEIDLSPDIDLYDDKVYEKASENLQKMIADGVFIKDNSPMLYIYTLTMNGKSQTGLVSCTSIDEYLDGKIKKHELTREAKEKDRIRHVDTCNANTGPIFLTYKHREEISSIIENFKKNEPPVYDFVTEDDITHTVWVIDKEEIIKKLTDEFKKVSALYIADGHHRNASAVKVGLKRREEFPNFSEDDEFNFYLSVLFPDDQLFIMDYNRVVKDLNGLSDDEFFDKIREYFIISERGEKGSPYKPKKARAFGMYIGGKWFSLEAKENVGEGEDVVGRLDVSILQNYLLSPVLGIDDPRSDDRIDFVGGIRGLSELEKRVDSGEMKAAFSMFPTSMDELMEIADSGKIMPPKSTWFEPKLRSGLFIHEL